MKKIIFAAALVLFCATSAFLRADSGESVVVVYNSNMPESKAVAEHYARQRNVPEKQVFGFRLPAGETMTRAEFRTMLERPLLKKLEDGKFFVFRADVQTASDGKPGGVLWKVSDTKIKYAVLCYGVPSRITREARLKETIPENLQPELRRNEAAVDTELALLPIIHQNPLLTGPILNPMIATTNVNHLHPTNGLFLVTRLDGPSPEIARGLVDKAIEAERDGLWGRAYFDLRGLKDGEYKVGDDSIRAAAQVARRLGFETVIDEKPSTFPASFPLSQVALYAGWYDQNVSGPFTRPNVEFMPGAFAYHLHSYSAHTLRSTDKNWVGPLLAAGATITMGCVDEPYLVGTPDVGVFVSRLLMGMSFGEAAYASQNFLSWQTTFVGDPLYRPFARKPQELHQDLEKRPSKLVEWSHLRVVNLNLATEFPVAEVVKYLESIDLTKQSAVLSEKLADLYLEQGKPGTAIHNYRRALDLDPTPQQEVRLRLTLAERLIAAGEEAEAYEAYREFLKKCRDYPDRLSIQEKLLGLARKLEKTSDAERLQQEIEALKR